MRKHEDRVVGLLGTVIIHLIAGIIFMSFQIKSLQKEQKNKFLVEFATAEEILAKMKPVDIQPVTSIEKILQGDKELLNIARNLANKSEQKINPDDYIEKVKEELIQSGKLGVDNYIDEQKRLAESKGDEKISIAKDTANSRKTEKSKKSQEIAANYKGPTRIYYDLAGRTHSYLPLPIYMCQGSGKVVLSIEVNQRGDVEKAHIIVGDSTTTDDCLIETAVTTALMSKFSPNINLPKTQTGTLTYMFVAQ